MSVVLFDPAPVFEYLPDANDHEIAARLGLSATTVSKWRRGASRMRASTADRVAVRLELHPCLLWPTEWWQP